MSISIGWDNAEQTIIYVKLENDWTWDEVYTNIEQMGKYIESVTHSVDIIYDTQLAGPIPGHNALQHLKQISGLSHPRVRAVVVVGLSPFSRALLSTFNQIYGTLFPNVLFKYNAVNSLYDARTYLASLVRM
jgi:hypothetical protein